MQPSPKFTETTIQTTIQCDLWLQNQTKQFQLVLYASLPFLLQLINRKTTNQLQNLMKTIQRSPFKDRRCSQRLQKNKYQEKQAREYTFSQHCFNSNSKQINRLNTVRQSKQTLSTNNSFKDQHQSSLVAQVAQNFQDFTFYPSDIQKLQLQQSSPLKSIYKFSNESFQCVLFFALIYNHLHLQEIKQNLPEITLISHNCYELIKKNLLKYDQIMIQRQLQNYIFPESAFRLIQNKALNLRDRKQWLKDLINKIHCSLSAQLVEQMCKDAKINSKLDSLSNAQEYKNLTNIDKLASHLGIKIKFYSDSKKISLGKKNSCITVTIKETEDNYFHLKRLTCYEQSS